MNPRTPRTDAWRARLAKALETRGLKAELARYLALDGNTFDSRVVQVARVLNQDWNPNPEFVLATLEWMDAVEQSLCKDASKAKKRQGTPSSDGPG